MAPTAWAKCLSAHVLLVSLNPSSDGTSWLRRTGRPVSQAAHGNGMLALNCQFTRVTAIRLLSVADPEIAKHGAAWPSNPADSVASAKLRG